MSTYKSYWSWSVSQFSTCLTLLRHGCQRNSFWNSQTDSQMYTFPDQINLQFVQVLMASKFHSKLRVLDTDDVKQKTSLFSVQGKSAWYCFKAVVLLFYTSSVSGTQNKCPNSHHKTILTTHLLHEFIVTHLAFLFAVWIFSFIYKFFFLFSVQLLVVCTWPLTKSFINNLNKAAQSL